MQCRKCLTDKSNDQFSFKDKIKGSRHTICKECKKSYNKIHYQNNKDSYIEKSLRNNITYRKQRIDFINEYKSTIGCKYCKEKRYPCLDFHHSNNDKEFSIGKKKHYSKTKLIEEMEKCEVVCSNCHRLIHANQL